MKIHIAMFLLFLISCKSNVHKIFPFGNSENAIRAKLHIPIIEDDMINKMEYLRYAGNRWESENLYSDFGEMPKHVIKVVTLSKCDTCVERNEMDVFRKMGNDGEILQLNIDTKIHNRNSATRKGRVFVFNDTTDRSEITLDETGIGSVCKSWGLTSLIKSVEKNTGNK